MASDVRWSTCLLHGRAAQPSKAAKGNPRSQGATAVQPTLGRSTPRFRLKSEISEMSRTARTAGTVVLMIAAFAALDILAARPEAGITVTEQGAEGAGSPPAISPFDIMLKLGKSLPLESWNSGYLIFEGR